ncbi:helix-turn-helix transcriptional regulator [Halomonas sp. QX-2]|uniref:Helix-turn-helix transcriptional regulator n=1 Tax=Vreelandella sedimenti TaxID=2729618 RepID=A0A7Z0N951_9GAMM|nr:helix-turn-helix transcriptional regulator [Halomonas sedimenti]
MRDNYTEPLRIAELAAKVNMRVPSFHRHFKQVTSMAPVQFQKRVRPSGSAPPLALYRQHFITRV